MKNFILFLLTFLTSVSAIKAQSISAENDPSIDPQIREFLKALNNSGGKPLETLSPAEARQVLVSAQQSVEVDYSGIEESEKTITQDGETITIHIVKPEGADANPPVFMFFHGGGWVLGDYATHRRLVRDLVVNSGAVAVFPDYTPSPEAQYPKAINQAYAATKWVAKNGRQIGVDGSRLAVVGNSVGGNMAAVVALMAKDKGTPTISQQILLWPVTDSDFSRASYESFGEERFLTTSLMKWMWDNYTTDVNERKEKYATPIHASIEELRGLPPALVQTAENDILRDEGEAYARKMSEAGVPVTLTRYQGLIHDYGLLNPLAHVPAVQTAIIQAAIVLKEGLDSSNSNK
ncbi:alpha/beta hydrolase [Marinoscillum sp. 108]|mgnify:CR=1 FL=1|jgi:acetyl esterase|uniref:Alpha/beta hydrolase n=1 Tax=Marinoscillum luteum TaxID=861051 RepID=A0ABW7NE91_9BACT|nr:alpha/beta hydrolase [Marinoscillum sp. 108]VXD14566.1 Alpha/beta hydrolase fold protein-3 domain protein [Marinoscillum sp. 108]